MSKCSSHYYSEIYLEESAQRPSQEGIYTKGEAMFGVCLRSSCKGMDDSGYSVVSIMPPVM